MKQKKIVKNIPKWSTQNKLSFSNWPTQKKWAFQISQFSKSFCEKEYFPNLLETWFWGQVFVYCARYFKFSLLAYFFYFADLCKVWERLDNIYITHFTRVPFEFLVNYKNKKHQRGDPCKMCTVHVVHSFSHFAQSRKIKN